MAKRVGTVWLLLILAATVGHTQEKETLSAQQILDRTLSVYASGKSYVDKGEAKFVNFRGSANHLG